MKLDPERDDTVVRLGWNVPHVQGNNRSTHPFAVTGMRALLPGAM